MIFKGNIELKQNDFKNEKELQKYFENNLEKRVVAIDGTLGNGYDTDFLCKRFEKVYSFDVQEEACLNYNIGKIDNKFIDSRELACILEPFHSEFNLDYLKNRRHYAWLKYINILIK